MGQRWNLVMDLEDADQSGVEEWSCWRAGVWEQSSQRRRRSRSDTQCVSGVQGRSPWKILGFLRINKRKIAKELCLFQLKCLCTRASQSIYVLAPAHLCTRTSSPMYTRQLTYVHAPAHLCTRTNSPMYSHQLTYVLAPDCLCTRTRKRSIQITMLLQR